MSEQKKSPSQSDNPNPDSTPVCPYCQRRFLSLDDLTLHIVTRHTHNGGKTRGPAQAGGAK